MQTPHDIQAAPAAPHPRAVRLYFGLSLWGFFVSVFSLVEHIRAHRGDATGCGFTETISCDKVLTSAYAQFFGIPLGVYGMVYFAVLLLLALPNKQGSPRLDALWRLLAALCGVVVALALAYISKTKIGALCPVCMVIYITTFALFGVSLRGFLKARRAPL